MKIVLSILYKICFVKLLFIVIILFIPFSIFSQEHRGIWFSDFNPEDSASVTNLINNVKNANLNVLYPYTYKEGMSYHESSICVDVEWYNYNYDVLEHIVTQAKTLGLDVHPWIVVGFMPFPDNTSSNILAQHEEWGLKDASGYHALWLDFSNPDVQNYILSVVQEINTNYNIDGIQLDYIRYPDEGIACWSNTSLSEYNAEYGTFTIPPPKRLSFPTYGGYFCYSVAEATSATILTEFSDNSNNWPAALLNNRGLGKCFLINWNPAFDDGRGIYGGDFHTLFSNALNDFSNNDTVYILQTNWNSMAATTLRLEWMGINYLLADSTDVSFLDTNKVLIVPMYYYPANTLVNDLDNWVQSGGKVIFIGGVTGSISNTTLQQLIGGKNVIDEYKTLLQNPVGTHPWVPIDTPITITYNQAVFETEKWDTLQENILSVFVKDIHLSMQTNYPDRYLSAAVYPSLEAGHFVMQDWGNWMPDVVDYVLPMSYQNNNSWFSTDCNYYSNMGIMDNARCFPGIGASYPGLTAHQIAQQIQIARNYNAQGNVLFSNYCLTTEVIDTLNNGVYNIEIEPAYPFYYTEIQEIISNIEGVYCYPNPFNNFVEVQYTVVENSDVQINIFNISGQLIKSLIDEQKTQGVHKTSWNGTDNQNKKVNTGVYFCKISSNTRSIKVIKLIFI